MPDFFYVLEVGLAILYLGTVLFAMMAVWRNRMKGLWILAAAALLSSIGELVGLVCRDPRFSSQHPESVVWLARSTYAPISAALVALVGWGALAFRRQAVKEPNA